MGLLLMIENFFKATYLVYPDFDYPSKAYIEMQDPLGGWLLSVGTDKYTDTPVAIRWSDSHDEWVEVPLGQVTQAKWSFEEQKWLTVLG